ncbi:MAG: ABC transporter ATP-binding protein, partial [Myxococcota bacterium]|nr:ABC transporter ATP-binding protein [Myxococcota bacterium]
LLVLDESLNGLDPPSTERVVAALKAACAAGSAVLLSTHVLDTLERVADRVVMIEAGRVAADVPTSRLPELRARFRPEPHG